MNFPWQLKANKDDGFKVENLIYKIMQDDFM